jgi:hypothetical protein
LSAACSNETPTQASVKKTMGEVHTEFLTLLCAEFDVAGPEAASPAGGDLAAHRIANQLAAKYGAPPLTMEEVRTHVERGRQLAQRDPVEVVRTVLPPEEFQWWNDEAAGSPGTERYSPGSKRCGRRGFFALLR